MSGFEQVELRCVSEMPAAQRVLVGFRTAHRAGIEAEMLEASLPGAYERLRSIPYIVDRALHPQNQGRVFELYDPLMQPRLRTIGVATMLAARVPGDEEGLERTMLDFWTWRYPGGGSCKALERTVAKAMLEECRHRDFPSPMAELYVAPDRHGELNPDPLDPSVALAEFMVPEGEPYTDTVLAQPAQCGGVAERLKQRFVVKS